MSDSPTTPSCELCGEPTTNRGVLTVDDRLWSTARLCPECQPDPQQSAVDILKLDPDQLSRAVSEGALDVDAVDWEAALNEASIESLPDDAPVEL
jgi:hypothetical protein